MNRIVIYIMIIFLIGNCDTIKDDCKKQKENEQKCVRAFVLFCSGNPTLQECSSGLNTIFTIGSVCKVNAVCTSAQEDVVSEKIQFGDEK